MTNKKDCPVVFEKEGHKYVLKETGELLLSGTSFIGLFHDKFDPTGSITEKYAKKVKKTVEEVKEMWRAENKKSTDYGTAVHNTLEDFINTGEITNEEYAWVVAEFKKVPIYGTLVSEKMVYNEDLLLCGTVDLFDVYKNKKGVLCARILDFKTNKKLERYSYFGNKMNYCCSHLDDVNFNHYTLQLSFYAYLAELKGLQIDELVILYINPKTLKMEQHPVVYEKKLIMQMIDYYLNNLK